MSKSKLSLVWIVILLSMPLMALAQRGGSGKVTAPTVSSISPATATAGGAGFALTVAGSSFTLGSIVRWNGASLTTTYVSASQLQASISSALISVAGTAQITVFTSGRGGGTSNAVAFTIAPGSVGSTGTTSTLAITTASVPAGTVGTTYSGTLAASGGTAPYTWSLSSGALPSGLALSTAGAISGTPTASGTYSFTAQVADSASHTATYTYSLVTSTSTVPLAISTASVPAGTAGSPYSTSLAASGGAPPHNWSTSNGAVPPGLALSSTGAISGTPTTAGSYAFTAQVTDSASNTATYTYSMSIAAATTTPLAVSTASVPGGTAGTAYSTNLAATGGTSPYTWSVASGSTLPAGLALSTSGTISGTPSTAATYSFSVQAKDSASNTASKSYSMTIASATATYGPVFQSSFDTGSFSQWTQQPYSYVYPVLSVNSTAAYAYRATYSGRIHFLLCGVQTPPPLTLSTVAGGSLVDRTYYVLYTYVSSSDNSYPNQETLPSPEQWITIPAGQLLYIASPPAQSGINRYNVYLSTTSGAETNQTASAPINVGTNWSEPSSGIVAGGSRVPTTNNACGQAHDTAGYMGNISSWVKDFQVDGTGSLQTYGLDHVFIRGHVMFRINPGGTWAGPSRKLWYLHGPVTSNCPNGCHWMFFDGVPGTATFGFEASPASMFGVPETYANSYYNYTNNPCAPPGTTTTCNTVAYGLYVPDAWYYVETEVKLNSFSSTGTPNYDGAIRVWVQQLTSTSQRAGDASPILVMSTTNALLRTQNQGFTRFAVGDQADRGSYNAIDEDRYWDGIVISGSGPVGP